MRPTQLFDMQMDLGRWFQTSTGRAYCKSWIGQQQREQRGYDDFRADDEAGVQFANMLTTLLLHRAESYFVAPEIVSLIWDSLDDMPDQALKPDDLPTQSGFVWLEEPLQVPDIWGKNTVTRGLLWSDGVIGSAVGRFHPDVSQGNGIGLFQFNDRDDDRDEYTSAVLHERDRHKLARLLVDGRDAWLYGDPASDLMKDFVEILGDDLSGLDKFQAVHVTGKRRPVSVDSFRAHVLTTIKVRRWLNAFWQFVQQPFIQIEEVYPDRQQRRRIKRLGLLEEDVAKVQVVTLRRRKQHRVESEGDGGDVNWSHRWFVGAHWRWQPYTAGIGEDERCPHCGAPGVEHRRILIPEYVKGPEDKPLVKGKTRVFNVSR